MNEIDNHADTICAGPNWKLLELSGEYCNVSPFSSDYQPKQDVPIAKQNKTKPNYWVFTVSRPHGLECVPLPGAVARGILC